MLIVNSPTIIPANSPSEPSANAVLSNDLDSTTKVPLNTQSVTNTTSKTPLHQKYILITNNPQWLPIPTLQDHVTMEYTETQALEVLLAARDRIHLGWKLINHPLYGNFRPYQQPFRSLLLQYQKNLQADTLSLHLIEQALMVYHDCAHQVVEIKKLHPDLLRDCGFLDRALLDASLEHICHYSFITSTSHKE